MYSRVEFHRIPFLKSSPLLTNWYLAYLAHLFGVVVFGIVGTWVNRLLFCRVQFLKNPGNSALQNSSCVTIPNEISKTYRALFTGSKDEL